MKTANFSQAMRSHNIRRIERHEPTDLLPREWFAVMLMDSILPGTGKTVAEAYDAAVRDLVQRRAA